MSVTLFYSLSHSRGGGIAPPRDLRIHNNDIEQWRPQLKDDSLPPLWGSYTMPAALLKMDHPCFFDSNRVDDGFRPRGGLFCLFRSADIFFELRNDFFVCQTVDTRRNNKPGPESNTDRCKTPHRTIDIGVEAITKRGFLRSCKPPEDGLDINLSVGLPAVCGSSFSKARSWPFGLFFYASELNVKKDGMKRIKRNFQFLQEERELYGELTRNITKLAT